MFPRQGDILLLLPISSFKAEDEHTAQDIIVLIDATDDHESILVQLDQTVVHPGVWQLWSLDPLLGFTIVDLGRAGEFLAIPATFVTV